MMNIAIAISISFLIPWIYLYLIQKSDWFGTGKFHYNIAVVMWGVIAYALAASINSILLNNELITRGQMLRIVAPIVEEILKSLVLFALVRRADFNYVVDGAIYGFGTGISFAMMENYEYVMRNPELAIPVAVWRVLCTNLVHATASGIVGSSLAVGRIERRSPRIVFMAGGLMLAITLHIIFNTVVDNGLSLINAIILGLIAVVSINGIIQKGLKIQQAWIGEALGMADHVTPSEAVAAQRIQSLDDVLSPLIRQFGPDKAAQAEALLRMQAKIGIKRKILELMQDEKKCLEIEAEIQQIAAEVNKMRKSIGPYCMLFVRSVYLKNENKIWDVINQRVAAASLGQAGSGVWERLNSRLKESKIQGTDHE